MLCTKQTLRGSLYAVLLIIIPVSAVLFNRLKNIAGSAFSFLGIVFIFEALLIIITQLFAVALIDPEFMI